MSKIVCFVVKTKSYSYGPFADARTMATWLDYHWQNVQGPIEIIPVFEPLQMPRCGPIPPTTPAEELK